MGDPNQFSSKCLLQLITCKIVAAAVLFLDVKDWRVGHIVMVSTQIT